MSKVLILGATSAIAEQVAEVYATGSADLFLLGRDREHLAAIGARLANHGKVVGFEVADFNDTEQNGARVERAVSALGGLDVAVIAHGWLGDQLESEQSFRHADDVVRTNFTSALSFVIPIVNLYERVGHGTLVVLSSVAGDRGRPRNYTYGAAKGALTLYLQGVRSRLYGTRVRVVTVRLGPVHSPMTKDHPKNLLFGHPPSVARAIVRAAERGPLDVYVPWYWQPIMAAVRNLPERLFQQFGFLAGR